jgi:hypothetical protein
VHKSVLTSKPLRKLRRASHPRHAAQHVHFHQGPQGQPTPCYDAHCASPRLSL